LKDQLLSLLELQRIDSRVHELRVTMEALPGKLKPAKQDLAKLEAMLQEEKDRLADTEKWRREQEAMIQMDEEGLKKAKLKVQAAKSTKDFAAASREVENKRRSISEREDEVLKVIEAIEKSRTEIEAHETDVASLRDHVTTEEKEISAKVIKLEAEAKKIAHGREKMMSGIPAVVLKRYDIVMRSRGGAVAAVVGGACQGCHMMIPPQLNNVLARMDSFEFCPGCQRLLYRKELMGGDDELSEAK